VVSRHATLSSTNDEAARIRDLGLAPIPFAVVAKQQTKGRGRAGRSFHSPVGGLYVSLGLAVRPEDRPGPLVAALAVAAAEAIEQTAGQTCRIKWPNDLWLGRRKVGGILCESAGEDRPVVAGIGVNVRGVPADLPEHVRVATTALDRDGARPVDLARLLDALLASAARRVADLEHATARPALEALWRSRLALLGERVGYRLGADAREGVLLDADVSRGLQLEEHVGRAWRRPEHIVDLRPLE
jgi:BirA family biotin operon repressor/biotin-[acetyl-CoA-carboxylase] ligase